MICSSVHWFLAMKHHQFILNLLCIVRFSCMVSMKSGEYGELLLIRIGPRLWKTSPLIWNCWMSEVIIVNMLCRVVWQIWHRGTASGSSSWAYFHGTWPPTRIWVIKFLHAFIAVDLYVFILKIYCAVSKVSSLDVKLELWRNHNL